MTLKEYLQKLISIVEKNPNALDYEVSVYDIEEDDTDEVTEGPSIQETGFLGMYEVVLNK